MCLVNESNCVKQLCEATAVNSRQNPQWRWQTGSRSQSSSLCIQRDFSVVVYTMRLAQLVETVGHNGHRYSGSLTLWWKTLGSDEPTKNSRSSSKKPRSTNREPFQNTTTCYKPPHWQMVKNDWTNIPQLSSVTSDYVNATTETLWRVFSTYSSCARLL